MTREDNGECRLGRVRIAGASVLEPLQQLLVGRIPHKPRAEKDASLTENAR